MDSNPNVRSWKTFAPILEYYNSREKRWKRYYVDFTVEYVDGKTEIWETKGRITQITCDKASAFFEYAKRNNLTARFFTKNNKKEFIEINDLEEIKRRIR